MKESNILVGDATIKQLQRVILLNTKGQYIKESYIPAGNATIKEFKWKSGLIQKGTSWMSKIFLQQMWLSSHYRLKSGSPQGAAHVGVKYSCRQCDHQTSSKGDIAQHKRSVHVGVKYVCRQCNYQVTSISNLAWHKWAFYEGVKYPCIQCD